MRTIEWTEDLRVGIDLIDNQHKKWIQTFNDFSAAVEKREGVERITETLSFLMDYTDYHFSSEEREMEAGQYPGIQDHKTRHKELGEKVAELVEQYSAGGSTPELADSICAFLGEWLITHIRNVDIPFGDFLRNGKREPFPRS